MSYAAKVICDSLSPRGVRLTSLEVTFPRIVLAEFNTHRMFSRNSASSRAIPVKKRIQSVIDDPFIPEAFGKNQPGMKASEDLGDDESEQAEQDWKLAAEAAIFYARRLEARGVHKQLANRLLEPFLWTTVLVTATEWANFFGLRCHPDAQPEIRKAAELMRDAMENSIPVLLDSGEWHLPYIRSEEFAQIDSDDLLRISAGRCARLSYLTQDGIHDPGADLNLCTKLVASGHMSPLEHQATPSHLMGFHGNFRGWVQHRKLIPGEALFHYRGV